MEYIFEYLLTHTKEIGKLVCLLFGSILIVIGIKRTGRPPEPSARHVKFKLPGLPEIFLTRHLMLLFFGIFLIMIPVVGEVLFGSLPTPASASVAPDPPSSKVSMVAKIEEPNYESFEIIKKVLFLDLRSRRKIPDDKLNERYSPVTLLTTFRVIKKTEKDTISFKYSTTGIGLSSRCLTHYAEWNKAEQADVHGDKILKTSWELVVNVSKMPLNKEFDIVTEVTYWNGFRDEEGDWFSTFATKEIKGLSLMILFPLEKKFKSIKRYGYKHGTIAKSPFKGAEIWNESEDKSTLYWGIPDPIPDFAYQIDWKW